MKFLNGAELRDFIKERQAKQVRALRQSWRVFPKLVIFYAGDNKVTETYMRLKKQYADDILVDVDIIEVTPKNIISKIEQTNNDKNVHGIIVQLPLDKKQEWGDVEEILSYIKPEKDVDGLNSESNIYFSATAQAIDWLLVGYNIDLKNKKIAIVGDGKLVGRPLASMWLKSGYNVTTFNEENNNEMQKTLQNYDVVVSAVGKPALIKSEMLKKNCVVVDAGTSTDGGKVVGDLAEEVRKDRKDLTVTPKIGGVGPLTIASLIDNVIISARKQADKQGQVDL